MTYNEQEAEVIPDSEEEWLNRLLTEGSQNWGDDITEREGTAIHKFYGPLSAQLEKIEREVKEVHDALRIETAEGEELDLLGSEYGIYRNEPGKAEGTVIFSRSSPAPQDYVIQEGTEVKTSGEDELVFQTTEQVTLASGTESVEASIEAIFTGPEYNVGSGVINTSVFNPAGVEQIYNPQPTKNGRDVEDDDAYRARILNSIRDIETASGWNIYNTLKSRQFVDEVLYFDSTSNDATGALPDGSYEVVVDVDAGYEEEVAQTIFENHPMGANIVAGNFGTQVTAGATLQNGQTFTIPFSKPQRKNIYVDISVTSDGRVDKSEIEKNIVEYIGGENKDGIRVDGDLSIGDDVVHGQVEYQARDVEGVYDVDSLKIGTTATPSSATNISIGAVENPTINPTDINVSVL